MDPLSAAALAALLSLSRAVLRRVDVSALLEQLPLDALPFETPLDLDKLVDTAAGGVIGNRADGLLVKVFGGAANSFIGNLREPKNHDLLIGLANAHARAFRYYTRTLRQEATTAPQRAIALKVSTLNPKGLLNAETVCRQVAEFVPSLIAQAGPMGEDIRQRQMLRAVVGQITTWIETEIGEALPVTFAAWLTETSPRGRSSWRDKFQLYLSESLKTEPRYERIFLASNLSELLQRTITLQEIANDLHEGMQATLKSVHRAEREMQRTGVAIRLASVEMREANAEVRLVGARMDAESHANDQRHEALMEEISKLQRMVQVGVLSTAPDPTPISDSASEAHLERVRGIVRLASSGSDRLDAAPMDELLNWLWIWLPGALAAIDRTSGEGRVVRRQRLDWLDAYVADRRSRSNNPYKGLAAYGLDDCDHFYGRDDEVRAAQRALQDMLDHGNTPAGLCVTGRAGSGKSSFMRAGVLGNLASIRADVRIVLLSPGVLLEQRDLASLLLDAVIDQTDLPILAQAVKRCARESGPAAVILVCDAIALALKTTGHRLVFAFDQLEEVVDHWASDGDDHLAGRQRWATLFEFMATLAVRRLGAVVYTLETNRLSFIRRCSLAPEFTPGRVATLDMDASSEALFTQIIEGPFRAANYPLAPSLGQALRDEIAKLNADAPASRHLAVLPLLSLKLAKLFEQVDSCLAPTAPQALMTTTPEDDKSGYLRFADLGQLGRDGGAFDLSLSHEISDLAREAWRRATKGRPPSANDLDFFLPFVGLAGPRDNPLVRLKLVPEGMLKYAGHKLQAFIRARLITVTNGHCRLAHEAVIRSWDQTRDWLVRREPLLRSEETLRERARLWDNQGCPAVGEATPEALSQAGEALAAYRHFWTHPETPLSTEDRLLRNYCAAHFASAPHARAQFGSTIGIVLAVTYGLAETVERMLDTDSQAVNALWGPAESTPLHAAVSADPSIFSLLLARGADPTAKDRDGWTPAATTVWWGTKENFELLLALARDDLLDSQGGTLLHDCASAGRVDLARRMIESGRLSPTKPRGESGLLPVHLAAYFGHLAAFRYFATFGDPMTPDADGRNALHLAAANDQVAIVEFILKNESYAARAGETDCQGYNPLHLASTQHATRTVARLLRETDLNIPVAEPGTPPGATPLMLAIAQSSLADRQDDIDLLETVTLLLASNETDVNAQDRLGETALSMAAKLPRVEQLVLKDDRLDWTTSGKDDETPIEIAIRRRLWQVVRAMLARRQAPPLARSPLAALAALRSPPEDVVETMLANWPPTREVAEALLAEAVEQNNVRFGSRLLDWAPGADKAAELLWKAASQAYPCDVVEKIKSHTPRGWATPYWAGWTVFHRLCAAQLTGALLQYGLWPPRRARTLWRSRDLFGQPPSRLLSPASRAQLGARPARRDQPVAGGWDRRLGWRKARPGSVVDRSAREQDWWDRPGTRIEVATLPFYPARQACVARVTEVADGTREQTHYIVAGREWRRLASNIALVHQTNQDVSLDLYSLDLDAARDYLRFFCFFLRGPEGPFLFLEAAALVMPPGLPTDEKALIARLVAPPLVIRDEANKRFVAAVNLVYDDVVFACDFAVTANGKVKMCHNSIIASSLSGSFWRLCEEDTQRLRAIRENSSLDPRQTSQSAASSSY